MSRRVIILIASLLHSIVVDRTYIHSIQSNTADRDLFSKRVISMRSLIDPNEEGEGRKVSLFPISWRDERRVVKKERNK